jgi:membrane associated rhomboid family serine protease
MGIYDRDYYRREGPSFLGSFIERGTICKWLIGVNVFFFVIQMVTRVQGVVDFGGVQIGGEWKPGPFTQALWLDVDKVLSGQVWRLLTYAFLHDTANIWHILFNMLFLWWFGSDVEDLYGPREFLTFYLTSAVVGGVAFVLGALAGLPPPPAIALGASGAVTAVLVLCACHFPRRVIYLFMFLPVPIWAFVVFSVVQDTFGLLGGVHTGVASAVHLGGAAFGFLYYKYHWRLTGLLPQLKTWNRRRSQPRLRVYHEEEAKAPVSVAAAAPVDDELLEAKMDAILEKISRVGKENLTESELQVLRRASEKFKRRRS